MEVHEPIALQLPEDMALFRRYVDPRVGGAAVGMTKVPRVGAKEMKGLETKAARSANGRK